MTHAVLASLIHAPLRPLLRLWRIVAYFLANLDHILETDFDRYAYSEAGRRELEAGIAFGEDGINIMIYARTCELLGVAPIIRRPIFQEPAKSRPIADLLARHARMLDRLRTFEQRAQRRAARILRQIEQAGPLGLAATLQATSLALGALEATHRCLASLSPKDWGRWHARVRAHDGGGPFAQPRGPPKPSIAKSHQSSTRRPHLRERPRMSQHPEISLNSRRPPLRGPENRPRTPLMTTRAKTLRLKQAIKRLAPARRD